MSKELYIVGMAELKAVLPPASIITNGLGSCVGVCLWDSVSRIGGLAHIMLPDSTIARQVQNRAKYADTAIVLLIEEIIKLGANKSRLTAKIAGGAQMFSFPGASNAMRIGERNTEAVKKCLDEHRIRLIYEETGGNYGRTIVFYTENGNLLIKTINKGEKIV